MDLSPSAECELLRIIIYSRLSNHCSPPTQAQKHLLNVIRGKWIHILRNKRGRAKLSEGKQSRLTVWSPWSVLGGFVTFWSERGFTSRRGHLPSCVSKGRILHHSELSFCTTRIGLGLIARGSCKDSVRCCCSLAQPCPALCNPKTAAHKAPLSSPISRVCSNSVY